MKSPTNNPSCLTSLIYLWGFILISGVAFIGLMALTWKYQDAWIALCALTGHSALIAFMLYSDSEIN